MKKGRAFEFVFLPKSKILHSGSVCVSLRNNDGEILHLEPIDLKKLQTKSVLDYLADIAASSKVC